MTPEKGWDDFIQARDAQMIESIQSAPYMTPPPNPQSHPSSLPNPESVTNPKGCECIHGVSRSLWIWLIGILLTMVVLGSAWTPAHVEQYRLWNLERITDD